MKLEITAWGKVKGDIMKSWWSFDGRNRGCFDNPLNEPLRIR